MTRPEPAAALPAGPSRTEWGVAIAATLALGPAGVRADAAPGPALLVALLLRRVPVAGAAAGRGRTARPDRPARAAGCPSALANAAYTRRQPGRAGAASPLLLWAASFALFWLLRESRHWGDAAYTIDILEGSGDVGPLGRYFWKEPLDRLAAMLFTAAGRRGRPGRGDERRAAERARRQPVRGRAVVVLRRGSRPAAPLACSRSGSRCAEGCRSSSSGTWRTTHS